MTKSKSTRRAFFGSMFIMVLSLAMLIGTTFAWFSDSVVSGDNQIVAGNLDVKLWHKNANVTAETEVVNGTPLFVKKDGSAINWEPGVMVYENFKVTNEGSLALKYKLKVNVEENGFNTIKDTDQSLKDVLKVAILDDYFDGDRDDVEAIKGQFTSTVEDFEKIDTLEAGAVGTAGKKYAMIIYWEPTTKDNDYNLNNGKETSDGEKLFINLGVELEATQHTVESDSFNSQYDLNAWLDSNAIQNTDGTYTENGQNYVKIDDTYVPVQKSNETEGLYVANNGDKYVTNDIAFNTEVVKGGNITILSNVELTEALTLPQETTIDGNGNKISGKSITVSANVTFKDVELSKPDNGEGTASLVCAETGCNELTFEGVTLSDPQWDAIQITSNGFTNLTINNCTFTASNVDRIQRYIHHEPTSENQVHVTITNSTFKNFDKVGQDLVGIYKYDWYGKTCSLTIGGNTFEGYTNLSTDVLNKIKIGSGKKNPYQILDLWTGKITKHNL